MQDPGRLGWIDVDQTDWHFRNSLSCLNRIAPVANAGGILFDRAAFVFEQVRQAQHRKASGPVEPLAREAADQSGHDASVGLQSGFNGFRRQRAPLQRPQNLVAAHDELPQWALLADAKCLINSGHVQLRLTLQPVVDQHVGVQVRNQRSERFAVGQPAAHTRQHPAVIEQVGRNINMMPDLVSQHFAREMGYAALDHSPQAHDNRLIMQADHGEGIG